MSEKKDSKIVMVTGGSQGIGKEIVVRLLADGYRVHMLARGEEKLQSVMKECDAGENLSYAVLDLSDADAVRTFTIGWDQPLYGIVNNAGICKTARIDSAGENEKDPWDEVIATNLSGLYRLTRGLMSHLESSGRIINISSQLGVEGRAGYGAYCASKFGVLGLTKCWAKELGSKKITVNAVCPGWVWSEMTELDEARLAEEEGMSRDVYHARIAEQLELGEFNQASDIAGLVSYLLSPDATRVSGREFLLQSVTN